MGYRVSGKYTIKLHNDMTTIIHFVKIAIGTYLHLSYYSKQLKAVCRLVLIMTFHERAVEGGVHHIRLIFKAL